MFSMPKPITLPKADSAGSMFNLHQHHLAIQECGYCGCRGEETRGYVRARFTIHPKESTIPITLSTECQSRRYACRATVWFVIKLRQI